MATGIVSYNILSKQTIFQSASTFRSAWGVGSEDINSGIQNTNTIVPFFQLTPPKNGRWCGRKHINRPHLKTNSRKENGIISCSPYILVKSWPLLVCITSNATWSRKLLLGQQIEFRPKKTSYFNGWWKNWTSSALMPAAALQHCDWQTVSSFSGMCWRQIRVLCKVGGADWQWADAATDFVIFYFERSERGCQRSEALIRIRSDPFGLQVQTTECSKFCQSASKSARKFKVFQSALGHSGIFSSFLSHAAESFLTLWTPISPEPHVRFQFFCMVCPYVGTYTPKG